MNLSKSIEEVINGNLWVTGCESISSIRSFLQSVSPVAQRYDLVRVGGFEDGGYLIPNDLNDISCVFSPGVSDKAHFESVFLSEGVPCFLADNSVDGPPFQHRLLHFTKKHLGLYDSESEMRLSTWVSLFAPPHGDLILQMDIEGAEYSCLLTTPIDVLTRFRILVVEFHRLVDIFSKPGFKLISTTFAYLLRHFTVVHIHPNNCCGYFSRDGIEVPHVMEFTLLRNDRVSPSSEALRFPHPLDRPNVPANPELTLPRAWRGAGPVL